MSAVVCESTRKLLPLDTTFESKRIHQFVNFLIPDSFEQRGELVDQRLCQQHMPHELIQLASDGSSTYWQWTDDAVDADGDGVIDPLNFIDALAMTAVQLKRYHGQVPDESWRWASNRYYGSQHAPYFDGTWERGRRGAARYRYGVREYWTAWCRDMRLCGQSEQLALASF